MKFLSLLARQRDELRRRFGVRKIGIFGSALDPGVDPPRDVDVLVEFEEPTFDRLVELAEYLEALFQRDVDLVTTDSLSPYLRPTVTRDVVWCEG